jgi:hypothetical protein
MELFEFKDTFCVSLFKETKYNTSLKPNLLADLFQHSFKIQCKFVAENNGKPQWIFSKQGIVNSGCYIDGNNIIFTLASTTNGMDFFNSQAQLLFDFEYNTLCKVEYEINVNTKEFIVSVNDKIRKMNFEGDISDYSNVPLWIGTSNPFLETKNYFNGKISEFIVSNNDGIITDLDFTNVNRFKVWDKSGNGNFAYIEEFMNKTIQIKLNKLLAGNSLEAKDIKNVNKTII